MVSADIKYLHFSSVLMGDSLYLVHLLAPGRREEMPQTYPDEQPCVPVLWSARLRCTGLPVFNSHLVIFYPPLL